MRADVSRWVAGAHASTRYLRFHAAEWTLRHFMQNYTGKSIERSVAINLTPIVRCLLAHSETPVGVRPSLIVIICKQSARSPSTTRG